MAGNGRFLKKKIYGSIENVISDLPLKGIVKIWHASTSGAQNVPKWRLLAEISGLPNFPKARASEISTKKKFQNWESIDLEQLYILHTWNFRVAWFPDDLRPYREIFN